MLQRFCSWEIWIQGQVHEMGKDTRESIKGKLFFEHCYQDSEAQEAVFFFFFIKRTVTGGNVNKPASLKKAFKGMSFHLCRVSGHSLTSVPLWLTVPQSPPKVWQKRIVLSKRAEGSDKKTNTMCGDNFSAVCLPTFLSFRCSVLFKCLFKHFFKSPSWNYTSV